MKLKTIIIITTSFLLTIIFSLFLASFKSATAQVCPGGLWWSNSYDWPVNRVTMTSNIKNSLMPSPISVSGDSIIVPGSIRADNGPIYVVNNVDKNIYGQASLQRWGLHSDKLLYLISSDGVSIVTGGVNEVNFSNNVGIGIRNPREKLDVNGKVRAKGFCIGDDCITSWPSGGGGSVLPSGEEGQTLRYDGKNWVANSVIFNNGTNVGIGTTNPTQKLDVAGYVKGQSGLCIGDDCRTSWPSLQYGNLPGQLYIRYYSTKDRTLSGDTEYAIRAACNSNDIAISGSCMADYNANFGNSPSLSESCLSYAVDNNFFTQNQMTKSLGDCIGPGVFAEPKSFFCHWDLHGNIVKEIRAVVVCVKR